MSSRIGLLLAGLALATGCGSQVGVAGTGGSSSTSTSTAVCSGGDVHPCLQFCGSDFSPASATCTSGVWVCPEGTVDPDTCTVTGCQGVEPGPCMRCVGDTWTCVLDDACLATCPEVACNTCPATSAASPTCACGCAGGELKCSGTSCCASDLDCGDFVYTPCVNGVCKPTGDGCWSSAECNGLGCSGAFVCPCGQVCDEPDHQGFCEGPP